MSTATRQEHIRLIRVFVSSPNDVSKEREALDDVVEDINRADGQTKKFVVQLFKWEKNVIPQIDETPQGVVDRQTPDCDVYLGILRTRFGTPAGTYGSGTEQEFRAALQSFNTRRRPWVSFYFYNGPVQLRTGEEREQYNKVCVFRDELERKGIIGLYDKIGGNRDGFRAQVRHHLIKLADNIIAESSSQADELKQAVTHGAQPPSPTNLVCDASHLALDVMGPSYTLDNNYYFVDWNPAFDAIVAEPLGLSRFDHSVDFIKRLENCDEIIERSKIVFGPGKDPLVDTEDLLFQSPAYGLTKFRKIAALMNGDKRDPARWTVNLNIASAEKDSSLWGDLQQRLQDFVNWSRYAASYDRLLTPFTDYNELVDLLTAQMGDVEICADLGAGTGNASLKLLQTRPDRQVWSIDSNEMMLRCLKQKAAAHLARLTVIKDDIVRLGALRDQNNFFDAVLMMNVLYAVQDPGACLQQAHRILKPGGVLVLSTSHRGTDIKKLLAKLRSVLQTKGLFGSLAEEFETVKLVHERMDSLIHRDTKEDIREYLERAGFEIQNWRDSEYVDSVVMVRAVKPLL
jgi:ubiquinone/menaquinone biosynthesis C-methylase UbiE